MDVDEDEVSSGVEFLKQQPEWLEGDDDQRRTWLRDVGVKSRSVLEPDIHHGVMSKMWGEVEGGALKQAGQFAGTAVKETAASFPAMGGAAILGFLDGINQSNSGSGVRFARGFADLASGTKQRIKSLHPDDLQEKRDEALDALKEDLDNHAYPQGLEAWIAGDDEAADADEDTRLWVDMLTKDIPERAVRAEHGMEYKPEQLQRYLDSDRSLAAKQSMAEEFGPPPRDLLAGYIATRDPQIWEALRRRMSETDTQLNTRLAKWQAEGELRENIARMGGEDTLMGNLTRRSADIQGSPIDIGASLVPFFKGARAAMAARAGSRMEALRKVGEGVLAEGLSEGATEALMDPNAPTSQILEAGAMGALGGGAVSGAGMAVGEVFKDRSAPIQDATPAVEEIPLEGDEPLPTPEVLRDLEVLDEMVQEGQPAPAGTASKPTNDEATGRKQLQVQEQQEGPLAEMAAAMGAADTATATAVPASRLKMAEKVLTTQGVEPEVAKALGARLAGSVPAEASPEDFRAAVLQGFEETGGKLPGSVPKAYLEQPEAYVALGYTPEEAEQHAANAKAANAAAVDEAHAANRGLMQNDPLQVRVPEVEESTAPKDEVAANAAAPEPEPELAGGLEEPGSGRAEGPGASGVDEWGQTRFGQRLKANDQLKASWRKSFDPGLYKKRSEVEWGAQANEWIEQNGIRGAAELVLDPESGIEASDKVVLAGVLLDKVDLMAAQAEQEGRAGDAATLNSLATDLAEALSLNGSKAGQEVRAYGYLVNRSPGMVLRNFERQRGDAIKQDLEKRLRTTDEALKDEVEGEIAQHRKTALHGAGERLKRKFSPNDAATRLIDSLAAALSDTPPAQRAAKVNEVRQLAGEYSKAPEAMPDLEERLTAMGVDAGKAAQLKRLLDEDVKRAEAVAREKAGQALTKRLQDRLNATKKVRNKVPQLVDLLMKATKNGVLSRPDFLEAYAKVFDMPVLTPEVRARIRELAQRAQAAPEGAMKAGAVNALNNELAIFSGVSAGEALTSAWYANLLSGLTTQGINVFANGANLLMKTITAGMANHPAATLRMLSGMGKGFGRAMAEAKNAWKGGVVYKGAEKYGQLNGLELMMQQGGPKTLGQWAAYVSSLGGMTRYVTRALSAADAAFFYTAKEGRAHLAAARAAIAKGLKPGTPQYQKAVEEDLGLGSDRWEQAIDQAVEELRPMNRQNDVNTVNRRAWEIIDQGRPVEMQAEGARYGDLATYQQDPEGSGKIIHDMINSIQRGLFLDRAPVGRAFLPFNKVLSNLWSNNLDYTPIGILRGMRGKMTFSSDGDPRTRVMDEWERRERIASGVLGTALAGTVYGLAAKHADDDDVTVPFMIYAQGPESAAARQQMPKGWRPFTVKIGNKYWSYAETPMVFPLAAAGAALDRQRYSKAYDRADGWDRVDYLMRAGGNALFRQGVLSGLGDLVSVAQGDTAIEKLPSKFTGGFIPGAGMMRDITRLLDPTVIKPDTVTAAILRDVPVIRNSAGKPALNVFGEPVQWEGLQRLPVVSRVVTDQRPNHITDWLAQNRLSLPGVPQRVEVGKYLPNAEGVREELRTHRTGRADQMNRLHEMMLDDDQAYEFTKRSGQLTKEYLSNLKQVVNEDISKGVQFTKEQLQTQVDTRTLAARRRAMMEMVERLR